MISEDPAFAAILAGLESGDQQIARAIYERFIDHLVLLASQRLDRKLHSKVDPESIAHSALMSFFDRQREGEYELHNWGMVLGLLSHITFRKCLNRNRFHRQQRRNEQDVVQFEDWKAADKTPGPEEEAMLAEMLEKALAMLHDDYRRQMVQLFLDGYSTDEVANQVGLSQRTVQRAVDDFRKALRDQIAEE